MVNPAHLIFGMAAGAANASPVSSATSVAATGTFAAAPSLLGNPNAKPNPSAPADLLAKVFTAPNEANRLSILKDAATAGTADFKFDFNPAANPVAKEPAGGRVILATGTNFPVLQGLEISSAGLFFAPCGMNTPHIHPRATEVLTVVTNGTIQAGFVMENAFNMEIAENLTQYQGMAFPQGSIHWQLNTECTPQVAIAGLSSDDPGASSLAQTFIQQTNGDIVLGALGFPDQITPDNFAALKNSIPAPFVNGIQDCYTRCGIKH